MVIGFLGFQTTDGTRQAQFVRQISMRYAIKF